MKKSIIGAAIALGIVFASPLAAQADEATSGSADADRPGIGVLTTENVGGGLWEYGVDSGYVFSNYHHNSKYHTSSACSGALGNPCTQRAAAAGDWSKATHNAWLGGNTAWWNTY